MDDQHKHIEDWLKAAAQQPVPDDTGMEAKQQAWSQMASLLDNAAVPVPAQEPSPLPKPWFATGQGMLWLAAAAAAVGLVALVVYLQVNRHQTTESKEQQRVVQENVSTVTANELNGDTLNTEKKTDPAVGNNGGATVYGSTESDTIDEDNRGAAQDGHTAAGINGDDRSYGLPVGAGRLVTRVVPQGNKLWSGVTAGAEKRTGEKGRDAALVSGAGGMDSGIDEKAAKEELSNTTQPAVKETDTALSSNNLINKPAAKSTLPAGERSSSEKANTNKTVLPANQGNNGNNRKINNKPGGLPTADKTTDLAANMPGNTVNTSKHPYVKAGKAKPGDVLKPTQPAGSVSSEETAGKTKPGLVKAPQTGHPDNTNKTQPSAVISSPTYTNQPGKTSFAIKNATGTPNTVVLQPLRTVNAFPIRLPALPLNSRERQINFITAALRDPVNNPEAIIGGLALQAGFVYPLSIGVTAGDSGTTKPGNGLGFKLGALYAFPIARGLYLQPTLSASYLTGFGKTFSHTAVNRKQGTDSSGAASGEYKTDSTITPYTVKSTFVGGAGVNVAYVINKWIFSTGLTYQYALPSGTKGTPETRTHTDSLQSIPAGSTPAFSKQQLPGMHTLSWSLDAGYFIRPRIQVGVSYRAILLRSAGNSGFAKPVQPLQDKQLEFYIRVPLRK
ncbi:autotransporter outer membrane beta-barrel domain-containing protein [Chitinophaga sp. GbtcB8]|uniref:autotransporter outer membrane beta-barrel domain-containing protein n=1 Tax=Chitinophaga sp. GbtcB8 TaxID=2824753 RepID=UPI001C306C07|nr:autotransporter outer membrane beta-barrel domain-containing protein [Chitinophaga sp. GbtcB8]